MGMREFNSSLVVSSVNATKNNSAVHHDHITSIKYLYLTIPPFLIVFGTTGNVLSIAVLCRQEIAKMPTNVYLISLAVADILVLNLPILRIWIRTAFSFDLWTVHTVSCKLHMFFSAVTFYTSTWIQVAITVDRFIGIVFPFKYREIRKKHRMYGILGIIAFIAALCSCLIFYIDLIYVDSRVDDCYVVRNSNISYVWNWIDMIVEFLLPFSIMSVCTARMLRSLSPTNRQIDGTITEENRALSRKLTRLFIRLNLVFFVTMSPKRIYRIVEPYLPLEEDHPVVAYCRAITLLLVYVNNSVNFLLYILHGPKFFTTLRTMLMCPIPKLNVTTST